MTSHDTLTTVTSTTRESLKNITQTAEEVTPPVVTPVTTQQSSPVVESDNISLEYSQPSTPEADHMITKGFQEICQVNIFKIYDQIPNVTILGVDWSS